MRGRWALLLALLLLLDLLLFLCLDYLLCHGCGFAVGAYFRNMRHKGNNSFAITPRHNKKNRVL